MQVLVDVESRVCCAKVLGRWWDGKVLVFFLGLRWRVDGGDVGMGVVRKAEVGR